MNLMATHTQTEALPDLTMMCESQCILFYKQYFLGIG